MMGTESINLFIDRLSHSDQYISYKDQKYFIEGCCCQFDELHNVVAATLSVFSLPTWSEIFSVTDVSTTGCVAKFLSEFQLDGLSIRELLPLIEIVDE